MGKSCRFVAVAVMALFFCMPAVSAQKCLGTRVDFNSQWRLKKFWHALGIVFVPQPSYTIIRKAKENDGVLRIVSNRASGVLGTDKFKIDPEKYPVIRWRWRVISGIKCAPDANEFDDQPIVIYIGDKDGMKRVALGYRWETNSRCGTEKDWSYQGGMVKIHSFCLRNRDTADGEWVTEEIEYGRDFERIFGRKLSGRFSVSIGANSQNCRQRTIAEIDYIEFLPQRSCGTER